MTVTKAGGAPNFDKVDAQLKKLEQHFDIGNATGSRMNAILLGQEHRNDRQ